MRKSFANRRDQCLAVGRRASLLDREQSARAWICLAGLVQGMGDMDVPKFRDMIGAVRTSTIAAKRVPR